jgi:hypothetical protein
MWAAVRAAIIELLWPIIRDLIVRLAHELSDWIIEKFRGWTTKRNASNAEAADAKASAHEETAQTTADPTEAEVNAKVAAVWREVAEMFRKENSALAIELERLRAEARKKSEDSMRGLSFEDAIDEKDGNLSVKHNDRPLLK